MKTKKDFQDLIAAEISNYPAASTMYRARDARLLASLDAMASMLALLSAEQDVAAAEPFTKARDATVIADAAAKGVLPFGLSARMGVQVFNGNATVFNLLTGRRILDPQGRIYVVEAGTVINPGDTADIILVQREESQFDHTVTVTMPFYQIEVPKPDAGRTIVQVRVLDATAFEYQYRKEYVNTIPGDKVFSLQSDEQQRLLVEFGETEFAGYEPSAGEVFTILTTICEGEINLAAGAKFAFEYTATPSDALVTITLDEIAAQGRAALDTSSLREITRYPSIYNEAAVYLGNFDFLVRKKLSPFRFLSIWNEQTEEAVRGASVDNINTLFITAVKDGVSDADIRQQIKKVMADADDSYKYTDVAVDEIEIPTHLIAYVPAVYDFQQVEAQMREQTLQNYGRDSNFAKYGLNRVLYKSVYSLLTRTVPALQSESSDLTVDITDDLSAIKPEQYRYISDASLTIDVLQAED